MQRAMATSESHQNDGPRLPDADDAPGVSRSANQVKRFSDICMLALLASLVWGMVWISGNLNGLPAYVDDDQIFSLDRQIRDEGFAATLRHHLTDRVERMGRLVPVYLAAKVAGARVLGTNMLYWSVAVAAIGMAGVFLLYLGGRAMRLSALEALLFSLITVLGEQSVIWWRRLHGEGIGLAFLALGLVFLARGATAARGRALWDTAAVLAVLLATLSKESFILAVPGLCLLRLWLETAERVPWQRVLKRNALLFGVLTVIAVTEVLFIAVVMERYSFHYTGWKGFDAGNLAAIVIEFAGGYRLALVLLPLVLWLLLIPAARATGMRGRVSARAGLLLVLGVSMVAPQLLLYMSSGFSSSEMIDMGRFLIPASLGIAFVAAFSLQSVRATFRGVLAFDRDKLYAGAVYRTFGLALAVPVVFQGMVAYAGAIGYRERLEDLHVLLKGVAEHTEPEDVIVFAFDQRTSYDTLRFGVLLEDFYGRPNLYFVPITWDRDPDEFTVDWLAYDRYARRFDERTVMDPSAIGNVSAFIVCGAAARELDAIVQNRSWFDRAMYTPIRTERGHVAFLRLASPIAVIDQGDSVEIALSQWRISRDGTMTVRGFAAASEPIQSVAVSIDSVLLGTSTAGANGGGRRSGFEFTFPSTRETFGKAARIIVRSVNREIGRGVFLPRYDLPDTFDPGVREELIEPFRGAFPDLVYRSAGLDGDDGTIVFEGWAVSVDPITRIEAFAGDNELPVERGEAPGNVVSRYSLYLTRPYGYKVRVPRESGNIENAMILKVWSGESLIATAEFEGPLQSRRLRFDRNQVSR